MDFYMNVFDRGVRIVQHSFEEVLPLYDIQVGKLNLPGTLPELVYKQALCPVQH